MEQQKVKRKLQKILENQGDISIAQLDVSLDIKDALDNVKTELNIDKKAELAIEITEKDLQNLFTNATEEQTSLSKNILTLLTQIRDKKIDTSALLQKLEEIASKEEKETDLTPIQNLIEQIRDILAVKEEFEPVQVYDKNGNLLDWDELFKVLKKQETFGGAFLLDTVANTEGVAPLSGTSVNGTRDLTSANTWYAVPSTVPSSPYMLVVTQENATGTVRWGFDNTGTPSATNGNQAPNELRIKLAAGQVVYYASSTAGDDVNWTTKVI